MTLLEEFKTNLARSNNYSCENIVNLFDIANEKLKIWIDRGLTDEETSEIFDFGRYFESKYEDYTKDEFLKKYRNKEPLLISSYNMICSLLVDKKFLEEISKRLTKNQLTKRDIFEMNLFKKELLRIFNEYGCYSLIKVIHFNIDHQDIEFRNQIIIPDKEVIEEDLSEKNYLTIFLINCILCNNGTVVIKIDIEDKQTLITYQFSNGTWIPVGDKNDISQYDTDTIKYKIGKRNF